VLRRIRDAKARTGCVAEEVPRETRASYAGSVFGAPWRSRRPQGCSAKDNEQAGTTRVALGPHCGTAGGARSALQAPRRAVEEEFAILRFAAVKKSRRGNTLAVVGDREVVSLSPLPVRQPNVSGGTYGGRKQSRWAWGRADGFAV
jgi:hypothetical protein